MIAEYLETKADKRSLLRDKTSFKNLEPFFGIKLLHTITQADIRAYQIQRKAEGVTGATINRECALLRHFFNLAIEAGYVRNNPIKGVKFYKEQKCKRRSFVFTEDELQRLVTAAAPHLRPILIVAAGTGLRKGDILGLRWNQVDFAHNVISLSLQKTSEYLEVPMLPMVRDVLARIRSEARTSSYVFVFRAAEKIIDVKTAFHAALRRSGLADRGFCFHDLRRTFATMLYNRGVHLTKIQRLLGHASVLTTERYLGVRSEETAAAIAVLDVPALQALAAPNLSTICAQVPVAAIENASISVS